MAIDRIVSQGHCISSFLSVQADKTGLLVRGFPTEGWAVVYVVYIQSCTLKPTDIVGNTVTSLNREVGLVNQEAGQAYDWGSSLLI